MHLPDHLRYTESHEWVRSETDGTLTIGITDHAQSALGDVVFLELPATGRRVAAGEACAVIESVKAASDIYAPVAGEIVASNADAAGAPETVNGEPYATWLFRIRPDAGASLDRLMSAADYAKAIGV